MRIEEAKATTQEKGVEKDSCQAAMAVKVTARAAAGNGQSNGKGKVNSFEDAAWSSWYGYGWDEPWTGTAGQLESGECENDITLSFEDYLDEFPSIQDADSRGTLTDSNSNVPINPRGNVLERTELEDEAGIDEECWKANVYYANTRITLRRNEPIALRIRE